MKKYLATLLAILLILTSCTRVADNKEPEKAEPPISQSQQNNTPQPAEDSQNSAEYSYYGQYQMSDEGFSSLVKDNAIDRDYEIESKKFQGSPEFNTQGWVEIEDKYIGIWDKELNGIYNMLLKRLNEKERGKLLEAQKGWVQFHINESKFVVESWNDLGLGSQGRVQLAMAEKDRIRERTLQLMEYYYLLGGKVEFLYEGVKE